MTQAVPDMTCQELVELVTEYFEGVLSPSDRERFEMHLTGCRGCRNYLEQLRTTMQVVGTLREEDVPAPARNELLARFRAWKQE